MRSQNYRRLDGCFKSPNLIPVQLYSTKLGQIANLNMTFYIVVFIDQFKFETRLCSLRNSEMANFWVVLKQYCFLFSGIGALLCDRFYCFDSQLCEPISSSAS